MRMTFAVAVFLHSENEISIHGVGTSALTQSAGVLFFVIEASGGDR
jgi:hypothetical protein